MKHLIGQNTIQYIVIISVLFFSQNIYAQIKTDHTFDEEKYKCATTDIFSQTNMEQFMCPDFSPCDDPTIRDDYIYSGNEPTKVVRTLVRVIRETDGSNPAATEHEVAMQMHHLNLDFAPYGIQFIYEIDYIDNSDIRTVATGQEQVDITTQYKTQTDEYCNIFVGSGPASFGFFPWAEQGMEDNGMFINESAQFYPANHRNTLAHEMGHVLGLYHTFFGYSEAPCGHVCSENMGQSGDLVGDRCSDTPPQEVNFNHGFTQTTDECSDLPFDEIPHVNYMSYSDCKSEFTPQQVARMHCILETHPLRNGWLDESNPDIPYIYSDEFGYGFMEEYGVDNMEWLDIKNTGTELTGFLDDNVTGPYDIGFDLFFYGNIFDEIYIGSNGYVSFSPIQLNSIGSPFPAIPTPDGNDGFFAPFMADLNFTGQGNNGKVYMYSNQEDSLIITFENVPFFENSTGFAGDNTFQMIFSASDTMLTYQYLDMDDYYPPTFYFSSQPSTIGIESPDGMIGLEPNNYRIPKDSSRVVIFYQEENIVMHNEGEFFEKNILLYPNPNSGNFSLEIINEKYEEQALIYLYDYAGKKIKQIFDGEILAGKNTLIIDDLNLIKSGVYFVKIIVGESQMVLPVIVK